METDVCAAPKYVNAAGLGMKMSGRKDSGQVKSAGLFWVFLSLSELGVGLGYLESILGTGTPMEIVGRKELSLFLWLLLRPEKGGASQLHLTQGSEDPHQSLLHLVLSPLCFLVLSSPQC